MASRIVLNRRARLPTTPWTNAQIELLKAHFATYTNDELVTLCRHPMGSIYEKARRLGLTRPSQRKNYRPRDTLNKFIPPLREERLKRNLTQTQVAKEAHIDMTALQRYESGRMRLPQLEKLTRWANYLGFELALIKRT